MIRYAEPDDEYPSGLEPVTAADGLTDLVLDADEGIAGVAALGPASGEPNRDTGELFVLSLLPYAWACGHGSRLHDAAIEELRWAGFAEAVVWVLEADTLVRKFYVESGWHEDGGEKAGIDRGVVLQRVRYRRPVPTSPVALRFDVAGPDDIDDLLRLSDDLARWMVERDIEQWRPGELPVGRVRHFVVDGEVTVLRSGDDLVGAVTVAWEDPFAWGDAVAAAGYVHQLMLAREYAGQGLGRRLLQRAERRIYEAGLRRVRLDFVTTNQTLRRYYERAGYRYRGETDYGGRSDLRPGALYEKRLTAPPAARA